jgi:hypothetical protein
VQHRRNKSIGRMMTGHIQQDNTGHIPLASLQVPDDIQPSRSRSLRDTSLKVNTVFLKST